MTVDDSVLDGCRLTACNLADATFNDCDLRGTVLEGCETRGLVFRHGAGWTGRPQIEATAEFPDLTTYIKRKMSMEPANAVLAALASVGPERA